MARSNGYPGCGRPWQHGYAWSEFGRCKTHHHRTLIVNAVKACGLGVDTEHAITARCVLLTLAINMTGYTVKSMQRKIERPSLGGGFRRGSC